MIRLLAEDETIPYHLLLLADESLEAINKYIHHSDIYLFLQEDIPLGVLVLQIIKPKSLEIKNLAVEPAYQNRGIGKELLGFAIRMASEQGYEQIFIGTGDASVKQLYIYQKAGFEIDYIKKGFFLDNYPNPIYENGIRLKHMVMLKLVLNK